MKKLLVIIATILMLIISIEAQTISGKFIRFSLDGVQIKTQTDILNLPISKDLIILDNKGQRVSPASLFENADVTLKYENGEVKSIFIDNQFINYLPISNNRPEYNLIYRDTSYQYKNYQTPAKVSYVGYLPVDYQTINYPLVDLYNGKINYYSYVPVKNSYVFGGSEAIANEINFYNNLLANNYYSERYYYENLSSITTSEVPNYYYISKMQERSPYYTKIEPAQIQSNYYAKINDQQVNYNINNINGRIVEVNQNKLMIIADRAYEIEINSNSNILLKKEGRYIPINNNEELKNLLNKQAQLTVLNNGNKLVANTIVINYQ